MSEAPPNELDDELPTALGEYLREREQARVAARAPEWEAVASGKLSVDAAIARREAAGDDHPGRAAEYFRPFDADETSALVGALMAGLDGHAADPNEDEGEDEGEPSNVIPLVKPAPAPEPSAPDSDSDSRTSRWLPVALIVAAAAAVLLWWVVPGQGSLDGGGGDDGPKLAQRDALPSYTLETDGGLTQLRGDTGDPSPASEHRYRLHTPFDWILRPSVDASGEVAVRGFAFVNGGDVGQPLQLDALTQIAESGVVRVSGTIGQLGLAPGRYAIALAVGRPDALPATAAEVTAPADQPANEHAWAVRRVEITIEE
ncbi:hypothetical protein [Enhygromyxa salina]|uniref:Uncharacterized protein n=1 Tax=Enhygromyxa salina TaxID=215803 RepID=A0A2S9YJ13_9BACT|nr:hypothetical protein [Enhygromyxa salina]PRQ05093.1 hypothetical protein ENSA7_47220 [Enhygromyxa salina]